MNVVIFTIHLHNRGTHFASIHSKVSSQESDIWARQYVSAPFSDKDQMNVQGKNTRPAPTKVAFFYPSWHRPVYVTGMKRLQAYKYRLNVRNTETETKLSRQVGCARFIYNLGLSLSQEKYPGYLKLSKMLPEWKAKHLWLAEVDSIGLQQALRNLDRAWQNKFKFPEHFDEPTFKRRFVHDSYRYCGLAAAKTENNRIWVPKIGWITFRNSRPWQGTVKSVTISRKAKRWYVSLQCHVEIERPAIRIDPWVGVDVGIAQYAALSTGVMYPSIKAFQTNERFLARLQRRLARQTKKSNRWRKTKDRIAALQHHIANKRKDHAHKYSSKLVKNHGRVRMEDLRVKNMMASAKGTVEKPGKKVAQKTGLNRHLADQGLRQFRSFVEYKLAWSGGSFEAINPAYTSQTCHACKHVAKANRPTQAGFKCIACGHTDHADTNAAKNIRDTAGGVPRKERAVRRRRRPARDPHTTEVA